MAEPLTLSLSILRSVDAEDPYAFARGMQDYVVLLEGEAVREASLKWDRELLGLLDAVRRPDREPAQVAALGERLRAFLAPAGWDAVETAVLEAVATGRPVLLTLQLAAAELFSLPFELLRLRASGQALGALPGVLLRHCWPEARSAPEATRGEDGRVVLAWSAAGGRVPHPDLAKALGQAAADGGADFDQDDDVVDHFSPAALEQRLRSGPVSALVILAHGTATGDTYGLVVDDGEGGQLDLDAAALGRLLQPHAGQLRLVVLAACDGGNPGQLGNALGSVAQVLHRSGLAAVVASRSPLSVTGAGVLVAQLFQGLLTTPLSLEDSLRRARQALLAQPAHLDWASVQLYAHPSDGDDSRPVVIRPYRGLLSFGPHHSRFFFGRDTERTELVSDLAALEEAGQPRFLVVAGASGTGKSSVALAGAVPDLVGHAEPSAGGLGEAVARVRDLLAPFDLPVVRQSLSALESAGAAHGGGALRWTRMRPGADPLGALQQALQGRESGARLLLVVDQLEELFTHCDEAALRARFCGRLWRLAQGDSGVSVLCTIRVDFLGRCGEVELEEGLRLDRVAYDEAHRVFVAQMGRAQLRDCIRLPAERVGLVLEPGLAERMVEEVGGEPGALPLLSYTLDELWQRREGRRLTAAAYEALGGVGGALQHRADALVEGFSAEEQAEARRLLVRLVGRGESGARDTRRRVEVARLRPPGERGAAFDTVLGAFVQLRLLVQGAEKGEATVEVAHEALIRRWERLQQWLHRDLEMLAELDEVERFVPPWQQYGTLLEGDQLGYARQVAGRYPEELSPELRALVAESGAAVGQARARQRRRVVGTMGLLAVVAVGAVGAALVTVSSRNQARTATAEARARSGLSIAGIDLGVDSATVRLAILREIPRLDDHLEWLTAGVPALESPLVVDMVSAADRARELGLPVDGPGEWSFCLDHPRFPVLVGPGTGRSPRLVWWTGERAVTLPACTAVAASADGSRLAAVDAEGGVWWSDGGPPREVGQHPGARIAALDPFADRWATGTDLTDRGNTTDGTTVTVWSPAGAGLSALLPGNLDGLSGDWLRVDVGDHHYPDPSLWDLRTTPPTRTEPCGFSGAAAWERDQLGRLWAIERGTGRVRLCDPESGELLAEAEPTHSGGAANPVLSVPLPPASETTDESPAVGVATLSLESLTILQAPSGPEPRIEVFPFDLDSTHAAPGGGRSPNHRPQALVSTPDGGAAVTHRCGAVTAWSPGGRYRGTLASQHLPFVEPPGQYSVYNTSRLLPPARVVGARDGLVRWQGARWGWPGADLRRWAENAVYDGMEGEERVTALPDAPGSTAGRKRWTSPSGQWTVDELTEREPAAVEIRHAELAGCSTTLPVRAPWFFASFSADERHVLGINLEQENHQLVRLDCDDLTSIRLPQPPPPFVSGTNQLGGLDLSPGALQRELWALTDYCLPPDRRETVLGETRAEATERHALCTAAVAADEPPPALELAD